LKYTKKIAGIIIDGPMRDIDEIGKWDFPVYATGTTPGGPYKEGPGEVNVPIACGGVALIPATSFWLLRMASLLYQEKMQLLFLSR